MYGELYQPQMKSIEHQVEKGNQWRILSDSIKANILSVVRESSHWPTSREMDWQCLNATAATVKILREIWTKIFYWLINYISFADVLINSEIYVIRQWNWTENCCGHIFGDIFALKDSDSLVGTTYRFLSVLYCLVGDHENCNLQAVVRKTAHMEICRNYFHTYLPFSKSVVFFPRYVSYTLFTCNGIIGNGVLLCILSVGAKLIKKKLNLSLMYIHRNKHLRLISQPGRPSCMSFRCHCEQSVGISIWASCTAHTKDLTSAHKASFSTFMERKLL